MRYDHEKEKLPFNAYAEDIGEGMGENYMDTLRGVEPTEADEDREDFDRMMTVAAVSDYFDRHIDNHPDHEDPSAEEREQAWTDFVDYVTDEIERDFGVQIK